MADLTRPRGGLKMAVIFRKSPLQPIAYSTLRVASQTSNAELYVVHPDIVARVHAAFAGHALGVRHLTCAAVRFRG